MSMCQALPHAWPSHMTSRSTSTGRGDTWVVVGKKFISRGYLLFNNSVLSFRCLREDRRCTFVKGVYRRFYTETNDVRTVGRTVGR